MIPHAALSIEIYGTNTEGSHLAETTQSACALIGILYALVTQIEDLKPEETGTAEAMQAYFQCSFLSDGSQMYSYHISTVFEQKQLIHEINNVILSLVQRVQTDLKGEELAVKL